MWRFSAGAETCIGAAGLAQHHRQFRDGDVRCPQRLRTFYGHAGPVWCMWFDPDQDRLLSGGYDATMKLWSLSHERCEATLRGHDGWVRSLQVLRGSDTVVSGGSDSLLKFWNLSSLQCMRSIGPPNQDQRHSTNCLAAVNDGTTLLSGHYNIRTLLRWDLESGSCIDHFTGHDDDVYTVHSGNESLVVSGSKDRTVRVWDTRVPSGKCVAVHRGHSGAVLDVKLRGNRVVSSSMDKTVRMWDLRVVSSPLVTLEGHSAEVHCVDFRDRMVVSGSRDTSLKVWSVV